MPGPVVVEAGGRSRLLADALASAVPEEAFVNCGPDDDVPADAAVLVVLLDEPGVVRRLLAPSIEWVHVLAAGVDRFPFDALGPRTLTCSRGATAVPIAEWVLAVMLAFEKRLPDTWIDAPPDRWGTAPLGSLSGRTLGLIGAGAIATAVARRALSFDMEVVAHRRTPAPFPLSGVDVVPDLRALLARSDHAVVAAPATPATRHLLGEEALGACRPGLHLVNVARGSLIDQDALRPALDDGRVARASLDTVEPEPLPPGHWLFDHQRVRLSPHVSWSAPKAMAVTVELFVDNLGRFRRGEALVGVVDTEAGY